MKQAALFIACFFAGSLFFAFTAPAQRGDYATTLPAHQNTRIPLLPTDGKSSVLYDASAVFVKDNTNCLDCMENAEALPPMVRFPSNVHEIFPAFGGCSYLLFGLLGLLGVGLALSALTKFGQKEADRKE